MELGSGALQKTEALLRAIVADGKDVDYHAPDLDQNELARTLEERGPIGYRHVRCHGLLGTYDDGRAWLSQAGNTNRPKAILSLGSTIDGITRFEATRFLREWSSTLQRSGTKSRSQDCQVIIGLDANTDGAAVWNAYNDFAGDNRRVMETLSHANHDLGYEAFPPFEWLVEGVWDALDKCHNQYVVPLKDVILEGTFHRNGERILICQSYKWDHVERNRLWQRSDLSEKKRLCAIGNGLYGMYSFPLILGGS